MSNIIPEVILNFISNMKDKNNPKNVRDNFRDSLHEIKELIEKELDAYNVKQPKGFVKPKTGNNPSSNIRSFHNF
jgi:hypothetical protein